MLWTCLHLPDFSLQLALRGGSVSRPLVVTSAGHRPQVLSCNEQATQCGIRPGLSICAALALTPRLIEHPRDTRAETQALENLALWVGQFTPNISVHSPDALLLEVEGCFRLFGGLRALNARMQSGLKDLGFQATLAQAPTPTSARLFARAGIATTVFDRHELKRALSPLPLSLLNQPAASMDKLAHLGVRTIGECLKLPRDGLGRRFGQGLLDELDRALGKLPDPCHPFTRPLSYQGRLLLPAPAIEAEALLFATKRLVLELTGFLSRHAAGVTRLKLEMHHEDRSSTALLLGLSVPSREAAHILQLLRERLNTATLPDRVESLSLKAEEMAPLASRNLTLLPGDQHQTEERSMLLEHLRARLGAEKVYGVTLFPDHRPEYAYRQSESGKALDAFQHLKRPLWLLSPPKPMDCDGEKPLCDGPLTTRPERIDSGWWDGRDIRRDYFVARNARGETLWIFRDRGASCGWYVHGLFG